MMNSNYLQALLGGGGFGFGGGLKPLDAQQIQPRGLSPNPRPGERSGGIGAGTKDPALAPMAGAGGDPRKGEHTGLHSKEQWARLDPATKDSYRTRFKLAGGYGSGFDTPFYQLPGQINTGRPVVDNYGLPQNIAFNIPGRIPRSLATPGAREHAPVPRTRVPLGESDEDKAFQQGLRNNTQFLKHAGVSPDVFNVDERGEMRLSPGMKAYQRGHDIQQLHQQTLDFLGKKLQQMEAQSPPRQETKWDPSTHYKPILTNTGNETPGFGAPPSMLQAALDRNINESAAAQNDPNFVPFRPPVPGAPTLEQLSAAESAAQLPVGAMQLSQNYTGKNPDGSTFNSLGQLTAPPPAPPPPIQQVQAANMGQQWDQFMNSDMATMAQLNAASGIPSQAAGLFGPSMMGGAGGGMAGGMGGFSTPASMIPGSLSSGGMSGGVSSMGGYGYF